jgi:GT2 family glycosyltransferase/glycosyltransferase involved in cell wall biosynthesis
MTKHLETKRSVSVIVLNWDNFQDTADALDSLLIHTAQEVELLLVDNGSSTSVLNKLITKYENTRIKFFAIGTNRFFGEGNNLGAEKASGHYIVFLNNDVVVTRGWLEPLIAELENDPKAGAVGPKFVYPDGTLQEAGAYLDSHGNSVQIGKGQRSEDVRFNQKKEVHYVSAACLAMKKSTFITVGGFNFIYEPAYYEDTDLCFSIRSLGLKIIYQPISTVIHKESQTTSDQKNDDLLRGIVETNRRKFMHRWATRGRCPNFASTRGTQATAPHNKGKNVAIFTPFDLIFGGGEKYILSVTQAFSKLGYKTFFTTKFPYSRIRFDSLAREFGLDLSLVELATIDNLDTSIDLMITMGNEAFPPIEPIGKVNIHHCQFPFPPKTVTPEEVQRLEKIDVVVVNSKFTKDKYLKATNSLGFKNLNVQVIHPPVDNLPAAVDPKKVRQIISVGRFFVGGHTKNQHKLIGAFSQIIESHPDSQLVLVGGLAPGRLNRDYFDHCVKIAEGLPVRIIVDSDSETVRNLLSESSVYWHGAGLGIDSNTEPERCEHFGISLVEAMGAGCIPVVVGNGGPDEIVNFGIDGFKYQTVQGLIRRTETIFSLRNESINILRDNARAKFKTYKSTDFSLSWANLVHF